MTTKHSVVAGEDPKAEKGKHWENMNKTWALVKNKISTFVH